MGPNIVVFNDVTIKPPYRVENVTGMPNSKQFSYIKKMVERLTQEQPVIVTNSIATMQSQPPLPQRQNSSGNGSSAASGSHTSSSSQTQTKPSTVSNIKAN